MSISRVSMLTRDKKKNVGMFELTTDIHEASRGLFATAELLVSNAERFKWVFSIFSTTVFFLKLPEIRCRLFSTE